MLDLRFFQRPVRPRLNVELPLFTNQRTSHNFTQAKSNHLADGIQFVGFYQAIKAAQAILLSSEAAKDTTKAVPQQFLRRLCWKADEKISGRERRCPRKARHPGPSNDKPLSERSSHQMICLYLLRRTKERFVWFMNFFARRKYFMTRSVHVAQTRYRGSLFLSHHPALQ